MGSAAVWILWSGLLDGWDWVLYSVAVGVWISFPALAGQQDRTQVLYSSLFGEPSWTWMCTEFPGQVRPLILLCRWGKPWTVLSVQVPLYVGLLNVLHSFLCVLVRFPGQTGWRLYSAMSGATNSLPGHSRGSNSKVCKALCCLNSSWPTPQVPWLKRATGFSLQTISFPAFLSSWKPLGCTASGRCHQPFCLDEAWRHSSQWWDYISAPLPGHEGEGLL